MHRLLTIFTGLFILLLSLGSCKKKSNDYTDVTFVNQLDKKVTLDIYRSMDDYNAGTPVLLRKTLAANEKLILPGNTFTAGAAYYMDWYTDDLYRSNWFNDNYAQPGAQVMFTPRVGSNTYNISKGLQGNNRAAYLNGGSNTSWVAIDAYSYSAATGYISYWSHFSNFEKYHQIKINKNFIANYSYRDTTGKTITTDLAFKVQNSEDPYIEFMDNGGSSLGSMFGGKLPTSTPPDYTSHAVDTVLALFPNSPYYFMMVRQ